MADKPALEPIFLSFGVELERLPSRGAMKKLAILTVLAALLPLGGCVVYGVGPSPGGAWANYDGSYEYALGGYGPGGFASPAWAIPTPIMAATAAPADMAATAPMAAAAMAAVTPGSITATASSPRSASGPGVPMRAFQKARRLA
jgi:hypothetical protein